MITWVNGTFDILNIGHINLFRKASDVYYRNEKDKRNVILTRPYLIVGIDTDERVRELKGHGRPIVPLEQRIEIIKSIKYVDQVVTFATDDELRRRIKESGAKRMCASPEYKGKIIGEELFDEIIYVDRVDAVSTSNTITQLINENLKTSFGVPENIDWKI